MNQQNPASLRNDFAELSGVNCNALPQVTLSDIERIIERRTIRSRFLPESLFSEPGWEMLIFLALRHVQQHRATVSEACRATSAPYASAWRWLNRLIQDGLVVERDDPLNRRRKFVELTPEAFARVSLAIKMQQDLAA
jgi:DNA-binding MarR family transcriptional regulator